MTSTGLGPSGPATRSAGAVSSTDDVVEHITGGLAASSFYWAARAFLRPIYRIWPLGDRGIRALRVLEFAFGCLPSPNGVRLDQCMLGGVRTEVSTPECLAGNDVAVLYLHGGGFLFCGSATHRNVCARMARDLGGPVYSVAYRQLPEAGVGTSVTEAYHAYVALLQTLPAGQRVVVMGDSAGGFLSAKICELAAADGVRPPAALVGFSPLLDLDADTTESGWTTKDAFQPAATVRRAQQLWNRGPMPLRGARSMIDCSPAVFPATFLTVAAYEGFEPQAIAFTAQMRSAGRRVETHRWRRGVHAFPVLDRLTAQSREALLLTVEFVKSVLAETET